MVNPSLFFTFTCIRNYKWIYPSWIFVEGKKYQGYYSYQYEGWMVVCECGVAIYMQNFWKPVFKELQ